MSGDCCHYDEGYDDGFEAGRRGGLDPDLAFTAVFREWAYAQSDVDVREAALFVADRMGYVAVEHFSKLVREREARQLAEYKATRAAA